MTWKSLSPSDGLFNLELDSPLRMLGPRTLPTIETVLMVGPAATGKTAACRSVPFTINNRPVLKWDPDEIIRSLVGYRSIDPKILGLATRIEQELLDKSREMMDNTLTLRVGRGLTASMRKRMCREPRKTLLLVFIGPPDLIAARLKSNEGYGVFHTDAEAVVESELANRFEFPGRNEGFNKIYYINTFGQEGIEWLKSRIEIKRI